MKQARSYGVTAVVPVRNGADGIERALDTLLNQTYADIKIVICDNASTDATPTICRKIVEREPSVSYRRHSAPISALRNFEFGYRQVDTPYFLWAAHDDLRSLDYVEMLVAALEQREDAVCSFGGLVEFSDHQTAFEKQPVPYRCDTTGLSYPARLRSRYKSKCVEIYGLWRSSALRDYPWFDIEIGPDLPLLTYAVVSGDVIQIAGPVFYQWGPPIPKTDVSRARDNNFSPLRPFRLIRLSWLCAKAAKAGAASRRERRSTWIAFAILYLTIAGLRTKTILFESAPSTLQEIYRRLKYGKPTLTS